MQSRMLESRTGPRRTHLKSPHVRTHGSRPCRPARAIAQPELEPQQASSSGRGEFREDNQLAYELIQGPLARWTVAAPGTVPPTAVMVHGILGSKRNLNRFARLIVEKFPSWQILLVDLRCHGDSAALGPNAMSGQHNVSSAAGDVIRLLNALRLFPNMLIGHSFGGKCVMSMIQQFGGGAALPRPVQVWALDTLPGHVRSGTEDGRDHPATLLRALMSVQVPVQTKRDVVTILERQGFSPEIAAWAATNLRPLADLHRNHLHWQRLDYFSATLDSLAWSVDLPGIAQMYKSYEDTSLWSLLEQPPQGLMLDFVRAEGSNFRWGTEADRIAGLGHGVHLLPKAGHWVHTDNPQGLLEIMSPSFGCLSTWRKMRASSRSVSPQYS